MSSRPCRLVLLSLLIVFAGCGGGGGGGGGGGSSVGGGGGGSGFQALAGPNGEFILGVNSSVVLAFSKDVDPASVTVNTVRLTTVVDATGLTATPAGVLASYTLHVEGDRVFIDPTTEFSPTNVTFGFVEDALYEISFGDPGTGETVLSSTGKPLTNPNKSFFFRTPMTAVDIKAGFPNVKAYFVDDADAVTLPELIEDTDGDSQLVAEVLELFGLTEADGVLPTGGATTKVVPFAPTQDLIFVFNEALLPNTVLNPSDASSPTIRVLINIPEQFTFQPVVAPADLTLIHQQLDLTIVRWRTSFVAYPPDGLLIVEVAATVADLGGNSKASITGVNSPLLSTAVHVAGGNDATDYLIAEPFDDESKLDSANTSADWGQVAASRLSPVLGGGRGRDGAFVVDAAATVSDLGNTSVPLLAVIDATAKTVRLPVVRQVGAGLFEPRAWEFTRLVLPVGWTLGVLADVDGDGNDDPDQFMVQSAGHPLDGFAAPLRLLVTGVIDIAGTVESSTGSGEQLVVPEFLGDVGYDDYLAQGGQGGQTLGAAGEGGRGGDVLLARDTDADELVDTADLPLISPLVPPGSLAFGPADPKLVGVTGRSTELTATTLRDADRDLSVLAPGGVLAQVVADGELWLQPNVGIGSNDPAGGGPNSGTANQHIDENHRSFRVTSVSVDGNGSTLTIDDSEGVSMVEPSLNVSEFPVPSYAPIAASGDAYLLGRLAGAAGGDPSGFGRGGQGADPFVVINSFAIKTAGGGGGGGGSLFDGQDGGGSGPASDVTINQRSTSFGIALDASSGAAGGLGAIRGTGRAATSLEFDLLSHTAGVDPSALPEADLIGALLIPEAPDNGWSFRIADVAPGGTTLLIEPYELLGEFVGLTTGDGGSSGPGLQAGVEVSYLILPPVGFGGAGGGGSGVSVTGATIPTAASLPAITPGAGGGPGGNVLMLETATTLTVRATGRLLAEGGDGGVVVDSQNDFAGAGGGGGGALFAGAGEDILLFQGAVLSAAGGVGGGVDGQGRGGDGSPGYIRLEDFADSLSPQSFQGFTTPELGEENVGRLLGQPRSAGQSRFYNTGLANPEVDSVTVVYEADTDDDGMPETGLTWSFSPSGADGGSGAFVKPPFELQFNPTTVDTNGFLDPDAASPGFYPVYDLVSGRAGLVHDPLAGDVLYIPGQTATQVYCSGGSCAAELLPAIPGVEGFGIDIVSAALDPLNDELFLLERGTGKVHVIDRGTGDFLRTISLPTLLEGAMTFVARGADEWLVVADNRQDLLAAFPSRDLDALAPATTDFAAGLATTPWAVTRDGELLDIEFTGLAYDDVSETLWAIDALAGLLLQCDFSAGFEGESVSGVHALAVLSYGGDGVVPSAVAFDGAELHLVVATNPQATSLWRLAPAGVPTDGSELALPLAADVPILDERARPIAAGQIFLRFRLEIDGLAEDPAHLPAAVSFRQVRVDDVIFDLRNSGF